MRTDSDSNCFWGDERDIQFTCGLFRRFCEILARKEAHTAPSNPVRLGHLLTALEQLGADVARERIGPPLNFANKEFLFLARCHYDATPQNLSAVEAYADESRALLTQGLGPYRIFQSVSTKKEDFVMFASEPFELESSPRTS